MLKLPKCARTATAALPLGGIIILSGCGGSTPEGAASDETDAFSFMYSSPSANDSPYEKLAQAYMDEFPDREVTLNRQPTEVYDTTLRTQLQAGNASDLVQTAPGAGQPRSVLSLAEGGFLAELPDSSSELIPEGSDELYQIDGETYGHPLDFTVFSMMTNMTAIENIGLEQFPSEIDTYLEACATAREQDDSMLAMSGQGAGAGYAALIVAATRVYAENPDWDAQRASGEVTFADSAGWQETLDTVEAIYDGDCFQPGVTGAGGAVAADRLASGSSAGYFAPSVTYIEIDSAAPDGTEFAIQPFPVEADGPAWVYASSNYALAITEDSDNKEAAQAFLDWLSEPEQGELYSEVTGTLPVASYQDMDLSETIHAPVVDLLESGSYSSLPLNGWPNAMVFDALTQGVQGIMTGQTTSEEVLVEMDTAWDE